MSGRSRPRAPSNTVPDGLRELILALPLVRPELVAAVRARLAAQGDLACAREVAERLVEALVADRAR